jgi:transcription initiation factor TFIID subunit TAF12
MDLVNEFVTEMAEFGCKLAAHRESEELQVRDVALPIGNQCFC